MGISLVVSDQHRVLLMTSRWCIFIALCSVVCILKELSLPVSVLVVILQVILLIVICLCHRKKEKFRHDDKSYISSAFT